MWLASLRSEVQALVLHAHKWRPLVSVTTTLFSCDCFSSSSVVSHTFSALCMYSKFGHHPHTLGYLCAKFVSFAASIAELAHGEKSSTQSINQSPRLFDAPGGHAFRFRRPQCSCAAYSNSFLPRTIRDWNALVTDPLLFQTVDAFKNYLFTDLSCHHFRF